MDIGTYPVTAENTVNRFRRRATYDVDAIHSIVNSTLVLHVSFIPDPAVPAPVILPMIGKMGLFPDDEARGESAFSCYLHGYVTSRLMKLAVEAVARGDEGLPVCVAATKVDGFVLSLTPNTHSYNYRSAVLQGHAAIVADDEEKLWAMRLITNSVVPGRWENTRTPPDGAEMQSTRVLKVKVASASGKVRAGMPSDEKKDLRREEVLDRVWTGVIPVHEEFGEPQVSSYNRVSKVPAQVLDFIQKGNDVRKQFACDAANNPAPQKKKERREDD